MSKQTSNWIPRKRIRVAAGLALVFVAAAFIGSLWSPFALLLLIPALVAGGVVFILQQIGRQLSAGGGDWQRRIHEHIVSRLALSPDAQVSVLDIGCGDASLLVALLEATPTANATGVDFWGDNWDYAQAACEARLARLGRKATFRRMDAAHLDFPSESFDAVVSVMCFHEVKAPRGVAMRGPLLALSEALRVLRPGGAFVLMDRFADTSDYGDPADLTAVLGCATNLHRESAVATLDIPWPLSSRRALGPVEILSGRKTG